MCGCLCKYEIRPEYKENAVRTVERTVISHIVYEQNTHSAAIVCGGNSAEALLTSGIPLR